MTTLQRRLLFVAALLMCCASQRLFAVEDKCSALSQYHDPKCKEFPVCIWVNYVSVASDAGVEELADLMLYLREHDDMSEEIDERGHQFVWLYLRMNDVQCCCWKLLQEYVQLLTYQVHQEPDFVEVSNKRAVQVYRG